MTNPGSHFLIGILIAAAYSGCASAPPPKPAPPPAVKTEHQMVNPLARPRVDDDGMKVSGILGSLDQRSIQDGMATRLKQAARCFEQQVSQRPYLSGSVAFQFRVATSGRVKRIVLSRSSLGSAAAERCIVNQLKDALFPRPRGGEAEFTYQALSFQGRIAVQDWNPAMVKEELETYREFLLNKKPFSTTQRKRKRHRRRRRRGKAARVVGPPLEPPAGLVLTFYVDRQGRVVSAGMYAEERVDDAFADRLIENLKLIKFVGAHSRYAKVTVRW